MKGNCVICSTEIEIQMCCSGSDCGCMGLPIDMPVCSQKCEREALKHAYFKKAEHSWVRRRDGYKHDDEECGLAIDHYIETGQEP